MQKTTVFYVENGQNFAEEQNNLKLEYVRESWDETMQIASFNFIGQVIWNKVRQTAEMGTEILNESLSLILRGEYM